MQTLYIDRKDTQIELDRERILVFSPSLPKPISIALNYLTSIVISAKVSLSSQLLLACASHGISVIILDPRSIDSHAQFIPPQCKIIHRKLKQYDLWHDNQHLVSYAKALLYQQAQQQQKLLYFWKNTCQIDIDQQQQLIHRHDKIRQALAQCQSLEQLRGIEGAMAKIVFSCMSIIAPSWCQFQGRNRRPPLDPINVLLSLSYTLIYAECTRILQAHALDPMLGFYHQAVHARYSLACDLTECVRSDIEKWVMLMLQQDIIIAQHFSTSEQLPCVLNKQGRAVFYPQWEKKSRTLKKYLRLIAQAWAKKIDQTQRNMT